MHDGAEECHMALFSRPRTELPEGSHRWGEALEAALQVSDIASSERPLQDAVHDMVDVAMQLLGAEQGSIMLVDDSGTSLVLVASSGLSEVSPGHRLRVGESVAGRVLATGRPLLLSDVDHARYTNFVPKSRPISSSLVVPLRILGRSIGVLNLATGRDGYLYTEEDLRVAQLFADQAAGLIHRARLHERAERRSADLLALGESSRGLVGTLDVDSLLQRVLDGGTRLAGTKEGFACTFEPETGGVARGVFRGMDKSEIGGIVNEVEVRRVVTSGAVTPFEGAGRRLVAVGLRTTRGTSGLVVLGLPGELDDDRLDLLRAFAQQCATALGAAELHAVVERKESELTSVIHGMPSPIVLVDAHGKIVDVNPAAEQLFGLSAAFSSGLPIAGGLGHPEVERALASSGPLETEVVLGTPPRTYRLRVAEIRASDARQGRVLIMDDITAEREIAQTQRDFVAMIGHELRTPLTIIKGFARTALKSITTATHQDQVDALATIDSKASQLERLIEDLLYVSKIESREAALRVEEVDVGALVARVTQDVLQDFPGREIALDVPDSLLWPCDETKVALVVRHLVENALKFSEAPHQVVVQTTTEDDDLRFDVVDEGTGILSSDLPHIFERFRQLDSSSTREQGGTGVGLYLCAQLVRVHGGRLWVDSIWGKGSTFSFSIPRRATTRRIVRAAETPVEGLVQTLA
jgi:two-component system phosphate regulon sensor histidine kinase PhoR